MTDRVLDLVTLRKLCEPSGLRMEHIGPNLIELRFLARAAADEIERLQAELDAYRRAKQENDERFMIERDEARARLATLEPVWALMSRIRLKLGHLVRDYPGDKETRGFIAAIDSALAAEGKP